MRHHYRTGLASAVGCLLVLCATQHTVSGGARASLGSAPAGAAGAPQASPARKETLLSLFVTALDNTRKPVTELKPEDFRIAVGAAYRPIVEVAPLAGRPRTFLVVIDRDTVEESDARQARTVAGTLLDSLPAEDSVALLVLPAVNQRIAATTDRQAVRSALEAATGRFKDVKTYPGNIADRISNTLLNDIVTREARFRAAELLTSVGAALDSLRGKEPVITVLLSNRIVTNNWNEPEIDRTAAISAALGGPVYVLPLYGEGWIHGGPAVTGMKTLAERTGGAVIPVVKDAAGSARRLLEEAAGLHVAAIKAVASDRDEKSRDIIVTPVRQGLGSLRVPTRLALPAAEGLVVSPFLAGARAQFASPMVRTGAARPLRETPPAPSLDGELGALLGRASSFVERSLREVPLVTLDETYEQHIKRELPDRDILYRDRVLQARTFLARLSAMDDTWTPLRDPTSVEGEPVKDWTHLADAQFGSAPEEAVKAAIQADGRGRRFEVGSLSRGTTNPMIPLLFLKAAYRERFKFQLRGAEVVGGVKAQRVDFTERAEPTLAFASRGGTRDVKSQGSLWIEPETGRLVKAALVWDEQMFLKSEFTITYQAVGASGVAPAELRERYSTLSDVAAAGLLLECVSRYSNPRPLPFDPQ